MLLFRLLACMARESGVWLDVFANKSLGLRMDDETIRIVVGLRLGLPICSPYVCHLCSEDVDVFATHGLSCRRSEGRHFHHSIFIDIIHRALLSANLPSHLEPSHLSHSDGKRPDGVALVPWERAKYMIWDVTCVDTFAH